MFVKLSSSEDNGVEFDGADLTLYIDETQNLQIKDGEALVGYFKSTAWEYAYPTAL